MRFLGKPQPLRIFSRNPHRIFAFIDANAIAATIFTKARQKQAARPSPQIQEAQCPTAIWEIPKHAFDNNLAFWARVKRTRIRKELVLPKTGYPQYLR
jgi:hypothetical protein